MTAHPSRTTRGTMKLRRLSDDLIVERHCADAGDAVDSGAFAFAPRDAVSVREQVERLSPAALQVRLSDLQTNWYESNVAVMTSRVEAGVETL